MTISTFIVTISESEAALYSYKTFAKSGMARHIFERKINVSETSVPKKVEISTKNCVLARNVKR
jgi:predicted DNA-binding transcriptional regulator